MTEQRADSATTLYLEGGWIAHGSTAICPACGSVKEGTVSWHCWHERRCEWRPAGTWLRKRLENEVLAEREACAHVVITTGDVPVNKLKAICDRIERRSGEAKTSGVGPTSPGSGAVNTDTPGDTSTPAGGPEEAGPERVRYRVGTKNGHTIYCGAVFIGSAVSIEKALELVAAANGRQLPPINEEEQRSVDEMFDRAKRRLREHPSARRARNLAEDIAHIEETYRVQLRVRACGCGLPGGLHDPHCAHIHVSTSPPMCGETHEGYVCTLERGHEGDHIACGSVDPVIAQWPRRESPSPPSIEPQIGWKDAYRESQRVLNKVATELETKRKAYRDVASHLEGLIAAAFGNEGGSAYGGTVDAAVLEIRALREAARDVLTIALNDAGPEAFATMDRLRDALAAVPRTPHAPPKEGP